MEWQTNAAKLLLHCKMRCLDILYCVFAGGPKVYNFLIILRFPHLKTLILLRLGWPCHVEANLKYALFSKCLNLNHSFAAHSNSCRLLIFPCFFCYIKESVLLGYPNLFLYKRFLAGLPIIFNYVLLKTSQV